MSAYPGPAAVAAASEILEAAGYHPHKSTIINALRAAESAAMFDRREDEPARSVEDREPVGPYAPSRTPNLDDRAAAAPEQFESGYRQGWRERHVYGTPRYKGLPTLTNRPEGGTELGDYLVEQFGSVGTRIDGLVDVVLGLGRQMTDNRVWESERFDRIDTALTKLTDLFVDSRDEIERTMTRPECLRWKEGFDFGIKGFAEEMATARRETREAFERGRQQGDADRAQRGELATDEEMNAPISDQAQKNVREALKSAEEHRHRGYEAGFSGGKIVGAAEREAELLDQGWTPPGATSVDARLLEIVNSDVDGPTDYEVWRDAVAVAGGQRDRRIPAKDLAERLTADAEWFWELLQQVPVRKYDDADEYVCEACGDEFPSAGQRAAHEDEKHAATGQ